jgi:protein TonB
VLKRYAFPAFLALSAILIIIGISHLLRQPTGGSGPGNVATVRVVVSNPSPKAAQLNSGEDKPLKADQPQSKPVENDVLKPDVEEEPLPDILPTLRRLQWQAEIEPQAPAQEQREFANSGASTPIPGGGNPSNFIDAVYRHLERYRRYPKEASETGISGVVYLSFRMSRDGSVRNINVVRSSGHVVLDEAAVETIRRAQPLPRIPLSMSNFVTIEIGLDFKPHLG